MSKINKGYSLSTILSVILHAIVIAVLFVNIPINSHTPKLTADNQAEVVHAVAVNQQAVESEIAKIKQHRRDAKQRQINWERHLQARAKAAKRARARAQKQLENIKITQRKVKKKIEKAKARAAKELLLAQKKRQAIQAQAAALAKQIEQQKARRAAQEAKHKAQQKKLKQLQKAQKTEAAKILAMQLAEEQNQLAQARAAQKMSEINKYKALIVHAIGQNWLVPHTKKDISCQLLIKVGNGGKVLSVNVIRGSGNPLLDRSAKTAVFKTSPLPVPADQVLFNQFRTLKLTVRPEA